MNLNGIEIERKYLIRYPDLSFLTEHAHASSITQTYLLNDSGETERVRAREENGVCTYTHTAKRWLTKLTREEHEWEISQAEYERLLQRADPARKPICKTRWILPYCGQTFEIDIYPFWTDRAIMELELTSEAQEILLPPEIHILRDVSGEQRYSNSALAREIPIEELEN